MNEIEHPGHPAKDACARTANLATLAVATRQWASELGFSALTIGEAELFPDAAEGLRGWLAAGCHGDMHYMARHASVRAHPVELMPNVSRVISARMHYWPDAAPAAEVLGNGALAYVSRYALGRDYHKTVRTRLQKLAERIIRAVPASTRVFTDSAPVLEVEFAQRSGLGWRGKHTLLIARDPPRSSGSCFFIGEIFIDLPLPVDAPVSSHCGRCTACLDACPTGAIVAPYRLDARRCISYLTIEHPSSIPEPLRPLIGNRIYGCDDCQLVCPWNRYTPQSSEKDFAVRNGLDCASLVSLFVWSEAEFLQRTAGSPIRRIGHERWLRNIAVALGNAPRSPEALAALRARAEDSSDLVREHVRWALGRQGG
ncbi:MAG: tRNA epoxyqueuosine(34) reductase QueG [Betaproteobacteria bacterium]|nr:tRNA epoxyqueuosine(34) reductase QueG [Betaproteobacteria bacterium]